MTKRPIPPAGEEPVELNAQFNDIFDRLDQAKELAIAERVDVLDAILRDLLLDKYKAARSEHFQMLQHRSEWDMPVHDDWKPN